MEMKVCKKCLIEKGVDEFVKRNGSPDGYRATCKVCYNEYKKEKRDNRTELQKEKDSKYYQNYRKLNYDILIERERKYQENNKEKEFIRKKIYREENREKTRDSIRDYKKKNKEKLKETAKIYYQKNKTKRNLYENKKRKIDSVYRVNQSMRSRINFFIKSRNINKSNKTFDIIELTPQELIIYIENQFKDNMSWNNYGLYGWHIDHIIPLSSAKTEEEIYRLCHYTNLQPLWAEENLKKSNKLILN
jgi:hypothetical protein